jgi:hypothetical protein
MHARQGHLPKEGFFVASGDEARIRLDRRDIRRNNILGREFKPLLGVGDDT